MDNTLMQWSTNIKSLLGPNGAKTIILLYNMRDPDQRQKMQDKVKRTVCDLFSDSVLYLHFLVVWLLVNYWAHMWFFNFIWDRLKRRIKLFDKISSNFCAKTMPVMPARMYLILENENYIKNIPIISNRLFVFTNYQNEMQNRYNLANEEYSKNLELHPALRIFQEIRNLKLDTF